ncbi:MAG: hypothetical protein A2Z05_00165 [Chloroflexi bacterium RBG_16_60_22]|nr:MAG: hypothetical protein A2Z05_00165 [Chloroflexi bacterium RBG_16_60_22]
MVKLSKRKRRFIGGLLTAAGLGLVFSLFASFNLFYGINLHSSDFLFNAPKVAPDAADDNIIVVGIDDQSLARLGRFSLWPRSYHTQIVNTLAAAGARTIVFDILFSEAAPGDDELAAAIGRAGNVILPVASAIPLQPNATGETAAPLTIIRPLELFRANAMAQGHAGVTPDKDGTVRRLPLLIASGGQNEPALSLAAVTGYLRRPETPNATDENNRLSLAGRSIPLDGRYGMLVNYRGGTASPGYKSVAYADILNNNISPDIFRDKIVLIGITATGFGDTFWTPMGRILSGVELHATAINTILTADFLRPAPAFTTFLAIIILAFLAGLAVIRLRVLWAALAALSLAIVYFLTAFYFFDRGIMLDMLYPPLTVVGAFAGVSLHAIASERLEKSEITRTFGRYVSPSVATKILDAVDDGNLKLGGEERQVTVLFADVRNFTGISEKINPRGLVSVLNRYLSVIIRAVFEHGGMVNKFGGDSIMAVWNVPLNCPEHALLATRAAFSAQHALHDLQKKARNLPKMEFGIGVNTGMAVAGNMGSVDRLEYSVIGNAVNTAARLAAITPGRKVWVGEETYELIKDSVNAAPLAPLSLRGTHTKFLAYEIIGFHTGTPVSPETLFPELVKGKV